MMQHAYPVILASLIAFGIWHSSTILSSGENRCRAEYESSLRADLIKAQEYASALEAENNQLLADLIGKQPRIQTVYKTIDREVTKYVPIDNGCNLSRGAVRLRNIAGDPEQSMSIDPYYPALSEQEAASASAVTQQDGERQLYEWGALYTKLSGEYSMLLKFCTTSQQQKQGANNVEQSNKQ